jgi:glycerophosphoryl diester phosphodiesterase
MGKIMRYSIGKTLLLLSLFNMRFQKKHERHKQWPKKKWILGHRGARAIAPENTLTSFRLAMEHGADGVEFDVFLSSDQVPVVIHDESLERTTDRSGAVCDHTAEELANCDASKSMTGFAKEGIPRLKEVLAALPDGAIVNVELKGSGHFKKQVLVDKVIALLNQHKDRLCFIVSSFDGEILSLFRKTDDRYLIAMLLSPRDIHWPWSIKYMKRIAPDALHLPASLAKPLIQKFARRANMKIAIWTVNDIKEARDWMEQGIDGIFTDSIPEMVKFFRRK